MALGVNRSSPVGRKCQNHNNPLPLKTMKILSNMTVHNLFGPSLHNVSKNMEVFILP